MFRFHAEVAANWEILVEMIAACATTGRHWVLVSASTGFGWKLRIADGGTGETLEWSHPLDGRATGLSDFDPFAASCGLPSPTPGPTASPVPPPPAQVRYGNDWTCSGRASASFASALSTGGTSRVSPSRNPSHWRDRTEATIGPFIETNPMPCGGGPLDLVFPVARGRRYSLFFDGANDFRRLALLDEGDVPAMDRP